MPTRQDILEAAGRVAQTQGLWSMTTRQIAQEAHCSEGSIYNHFANKDDLLSCLLEEFGGRFLLTARTLPDRAGENTVRDNLLEFVRAAVVFFRERAPMLAAALSNPGTFHDAARRLHKQGHGPGAVARSIVAYLEGEQEIGRLSKDVDVRGIAQALTGACLGHVVVGLSHGKVHQLFRTDDEMTTTLVDALLTGITTASSAGEGQPQIDTPKAHA
ncbi:MAG TPA: TetR/AcrR family transcriptional regulator [Nitriliruptorales bacterium]